MQKFVLICLICTSSLGFSQGWFPVGSGLYGSVSALCTYDSVLYVAGPISRNSGDAGNGIVQWNGSQWSSLGEGVNGYIEAMIVYDDKLWVGGEFDSAGGIYAKNIAIWDGRTWSTTGTGFNLNGISGFAIYNGQLYAGGTFDTADGKHANNIAIWNGTSWDSVGKGIGPIDGQVGPMNVYEGKLYVAGGFDSAGGVSALNLATWDGTRWDSVNKWDSINTIGSINEVGVPEAVLSYDSIFYLGGVMGNLNNFCQWNDTNWNITGNGVNLPIYSLLENNGKIYVGGPFNSAGSIVANCIAVWDGTTWSTLGTGMHPPTSLGVLSMAIYGGNLYAAGSFDSAGGTLVNNIAVWGDSTLGVANLKNNIGLKVYPNPNDGSFTLQIDNGQWIIDNEKPYLEIYNTLGQQIYSQLSLSELAQAGIVNSPLSIDLSSQPNGIYLCRIITNNGKLIGESKLIIQR